MKVDQLVAGEKAHGEVGMVELKGPESPRQPGVCEGEGRRHGEQRLVFFALDREGTPHQVEGLGQAGKQFAPERRQDGPPLLPQEQGRAEPLFQ